MFDKQPEQHEMILAATLDSGVEEWYCPTCGRRFLMQWPPNYRKIILEVGDEYAIHRGGKTNQNEDAYQGEAQGAALQNQQPHTVSESDPRLEPYAEWMDQVNFERFWL